MIVTSHCIYFFRKCISRPVCDLRAWNQLTSLTCEIRQPWCQTLERGNMSFWSWKRRLNLRGSMLMLFELSWMTHAHLSSLHVKKDLSLLIFFSPLLFSLSGPSVWNTIPLLLCRGTTLDDFKENHKTLPPS